MLSLNVDIIEIRVLAQWPCPSIVTPCASPGLTKITLVLPPLSIATTASIEGCKAVFSVRVFFYSLIRNKKGFPIT